MALINCSFIIQMLQWIKYIYPNYIHIVFNLAHYCIEPHNNVLYLQGGYQITNYLFICMTLLQIGFPLYYPRSILLNTFSPLIWLIYDLFAVPLNQEIGGNFLIYLIEKQLTQVISFLPSGQFYSYVNTCSSLLANSPPTLQPIHQSPFTLYTGET